jgi:hypothetical protein
MKLFSRDCTLNPIPLHPDKLANKPKISQTGSPVVTTAPPRTLRTSSTTPSPKTDRPKTRETEILPMSTSRDAAVQGELNEMKAKFSSLADEYARNFSRRFQELEDEKLALKVAHNAETEKFLMENARLQREIDSMTATLQSTRDLNDLLRRNMFEMGKDLDPTHVEDHYITEFNSLKFEIQDWTATYSTRGSLKESAIKHAWTKIQSGIKSGTIEQNPYFINYEVFKLWFQEGAPRTHLVRHLIAFQIFIHIWEPFIFGMNSEVSNVFRAICTEVLKHGISIGLSISQ